MIRHIFKIFKALWALPDLVERDARVRAREFALRDLSAGMRENLRLIQATQGNVEALHKSDPAQRKLVEEAQAARQNPDYSGQSREERDDAALRTAIREFGLRIEAGKSRREEKIL